MPALPKEQASPGSIRSIRVTLNPSFTAARAQFTPTMPAPMTQTVVSPGVPPCGTLLEFSGLG